MIPLRDVIPSRTTPWITYLLIAVNVLVFLFEISLGPEDVSQFIFALGLTPAHFSWGNVLTAIFVHGGWLHLGGNLLSLWIFGDNVEDQMGHGRYLLFYLLAGIIGNLAQVAALPSSAVPLVGASGAIAGVMGAYLLLFPYSRILVLIFLFFYIDIVEVPAVFFLALWFFMQLISGVGQLANIPGESVGFWAHIGGFVTGAIGGWLLRRPERRRAEWWN
jgi:membrane associated rhomboid family serine protease